MQLNWLKTIQGNSQHNAFTDLCLFNEQLFCCFREATNHISPDGVIKVLTLNKAGNVLWSDKLSVAGADLRDPKLTIMPNGELMLICYARFADEQNRTRWTRSLVWKSNTGKSWSQPQYFGPSYWWLWRLRWQDSKAYGLAYNRTEQALDLYSGIPGRTFELHQSSVIGLKTHGLGYPNESDIYFDEQQTMYAMVRRDADTCTAQLGCSKPPYTRWKWADLGDYIGSPVMQHLSGSTLLVAGRQWLHQQPKTTVMTIELETGKLTRKLILPSAGDNAYPGMVIDQEDIYLSYYSAHQNQRCQIYLAKLSVDD